MGLGRVAIYGITWGMVSKMSDPVSEENRSNQAIRNAKKLHSRDRIVTWGFRKRE